VSTKIAFASLILAVAAMAVAAMVAPVRWPHRRTVQDYEEQAVRKPLEQYILAHATGKPEYILQAFSPDAKIQFVSDGKLTQFTRDEFAARFSGKAQPDEDKRVRRITNVEVTGTAAQAKIVLEYPSVTLTDYMSLLKIDGEWKIVNKVFNAQSKPAS
jgi:hypothetical protein